MILSKYIKHISLLILSTLLTISAYALDINDTGKSKIFINKRSTGTVAFEFKSDGSVHYVLDYTDGSFYEYDGTYKSNNGAIEISLKEGHGKNSAGIEMDNLSPVRSEIHLVKKGNVLIDQEYNKNIKFRLLEPQKAR